MKLKVLLLALCYFQMSEVAWSEAVFPDVGSRVPAGRPAAQQVTMGRCCNGANQMNVDPDYTTTLKVCGTTGNGNTLEVKCYKCDAIDSRAGGTGFYESVGVVCDYNMGLDGQFPANTTCVSASRTPGSGIASATGQRNCSEIAAACARLASGQQFNGNIISQGGAPIYNIPVFPSNPAAAGQMCPMECAGPNFNFPNGNQADRPTAYCYRAGGDPVYRLPNATGACAAGYKAIPPKQGEMCYRAGGNPVWTTIVPPVTTCPQGYLPVPAFCYRSVETTCAGVTRVKPCVAVPIADRKVRCGQPKIGVPYPAGS